MDGWKEESLSLLMKATHKGCGYSFDKAKLDLNHSRTLMSITLTTLSVLFYTKSLVFLSFFFSNAQHIWLFIAIHLDTNYKNLEII